MNQKEAFNKIKDVVIDAYYISDTDGKIVEYNRLFYSMFPRNVARKLKGKNLAEIMEIPVNIVSKAMEANSQIRLDEITAIIRESAEEYRFILSAMPLKDEEENPIGVLVILRDVTDEAMVQVKYQEMLERETMQRELIKDELHRRTERLIEISKQYFELKEKLRELQKGQLSPFMLKLKD